MSSGKGTLLYLFNSILHQHSNQQRTEWIESEWNRTSDWETEGRGGFGYWSWIMFVYDSKSSFTDNEVMYLIKNINFN